MLEHNDNCMVSSRSKASGLTATEGHSVSDFVVHAVQQAARAVVQEHEPLRLNRRQSELFITALLDPPEPNEALRKAAEEYRRRVRR